MHQNVGDYDHNDLHRHHFAGKVSGRLVFCYVYFSSFDDFIFILFLFFDDFDDHDHLQRHHCAGKVSGGLMNEQVLSINRSARPVGPHAKQQPALKYTADKPKYTSVHTLHSTM